VRLQQQLQQQQAEQQQRLQQQQLEQRERQQQELERERERAKAATAAAVAAVQPTSATVAVVPTSAPAVAAASAAVEETREEPEAEASARLDPQPAPEPDGELDDGDALTDCEDELPVVPPEPPSPLFMLRSIELPPKRDEDNYAISEHGSDSEAEEAEQEKDRTAKHIPKWCETYLQELAGQSDLDPDSIFGSKVPKCHLEDIFTDQMYQEVGKHRPKRARGSSGDWRKDRLARHEVCSYKNRMGQVRTWDPACAPSSAAGASLDGARRQH